MTDENKGCGCGCGEHEQHHDCTDDCGCGHDHDGEMEVLILEMEDGTEVECYVIGVFEALDKQYIALAPTDDEQVLLFQYVESEEGFELLDIESDEEYEEVFKVFEEAVEE